MIYEVHAHRRAISSLVDLYFLDRFGSPPVLRLALPFEFSDPLSDAVAVSHGPTCSLSSSAVQFLIDELWRVGFRPSEGSGSAGSLAATERHLADMRKLVFSRVPGGAPQ